jgi:CubicO group peptidase (beta-lactamase class C family)
MYHYDHDGNMRTRQCEFAVPGRTLLAIARIKARRGTVWLALILGLAIQPALGNALDGAVDSYVSDVMAKRHIPGLALAVIRQGRIERLAAYGQASIEFAVPVTPTTLFNVASVTKSFTAVAVMKLVEAGKVSLDDSIGTYLQVPGRWRKVRIRDLLGHTSGLPDITKAPSPDLIADTPEKAMSLLRDRPLDFAPGTQYRYDQTDYMLLGLLIEKLSGMSYVRFCQTQLFAPAGLQNPQFGDSRTLIKNRGPVYSPYHWNSKGVPIPSGALEVLNGKSPPMVYPNNGLNISVEDLARWLVALMNYKVIDKASLDALLSPLRFNNGSLSTIPPSPDYPWRAQAVGGLPLIPDEQHPAAGATGGPYAAYLLYPRDKLAVAVLTNTQESDQDSIVSDIARKYLVASPGDNQ